MLARVLDQEAGPARDREFEHADDAAALDPRRRCYLGGMTLAVPGATGFVALAQRAVIKHVRAAPGHVT